MKKMVILVLVLAVLSACALQNVKTDANIFAGHSFDEVWAACLRASLDVEMRIVNSEKDAGILVLTKEANIWTQNEAPQMNVIVEESQGYVNVIVQYVEKGQLYNLFGTPRKTIREFLAAVHARLGR